VGQGGEANRTTLVCITMCCVSPGCKVLVGSLTKERYVWSLCKAWHLQMQGPLGMAHNECVKAIETMTNCQKNFECHVTSR
jgi:hypothetical protein